MSFIRFSEGQLLVGNDAGSTFRKVIGLLKTIVDEQGLSVLAGLEKLLSGSPNATEHALLEALRMWVAEHGRNKLGNLLEPLNVIEIRQNKSERQLGWPAKQWTLPADFTAGIAPFTLTLDATGGAFFEVSADSIEDNDAGPQARARIILNGELVAGAGADVSVPYGGISGKIEARASRTLSFGYHFERHSTLTGVALGSALSLIANPADGRSVAGQFASERDARLDEIAIDGAQAFGGNVGITANFPTQYGTPGINLSGKLKVLSGYRYTIRSAGEGRLEVRASANKSRSHEGEIGLSYTVGLSTIAPDAAKALLRHVTDLHELIVGIDERSEEIAGTIKTWLKPGHLIQEKLSARVAELFHTADQRLPGSAAAGLARLFGIDGAEQDLTSDDVIQYISDQTGAMIGSLLDELPEALSIDQMQLRQRLKDAFVGAVDPEIISILDTNVFSAAKEEIDTSLQSIAEKIDAGFKRHLDEFLGTEAVDVVDAVRKFIMRAREISQEVLQRVSRAQTELLSAEIGWMRAKQRHGVTEYAALFDVKSDKGEVNYRKAILRPGEFGTLLFSDTPLDGVEVLQAERVRTITAKRGPRWSIALLGLALKGNHSKSRSIRIIESADGVIIETNNALERQRKFLRETRRVSFVTALNILEARPLAHRDGEPNAAANIKIHFAEEDSGMSLREAEYLLERFADQPKLLSTSTLAAISREIRSAADEAGRRHVPATLSVGLAIAPSSVIAMLEYLHNQAVKPVGLAALTDDPVTVAIVSALAAVDDEGISELAGDDVGGSDVEVADAQMVTKLDTPAEREHFLNDVIAESKGLGSRGLSQSRLKSRRRHDKQAREKQDHYVDAIDSLQDVLRLAAEIYFGDHTVDELDITAVTEQVTNWQKEMNDLAGDFLKTGTPPPDAFRLFWKGRAPKKTVALFLALQSLAQQATGVRPPLKVTFQPKKGDTKSFFSLPA